MKKIGVKGALKTFDPGGGAHHGPSVVISGPRFFVLFSLFFFLFVLEFSQTVLSVGVLKNLLLYF